MIQLTHLAPTNVHRSICVYLELNSLAVTWTLKCLKMSRRDIYFTFRTQIQNYYFEQFFKTFCWRKCIGYFRFHFGCWNKWKRKIFGTQLASCNSTTMYVIPYLVLQMEMWDNDNFLHFGDDFMGECEMQTNDHFDCHFIGRSLIEGSGYNNVPDVYFRFHLHQQFCPGMSQLEIIKWKSVRRQLYTLSKWSERCWSYKTSQKPVKIL